MTNLTIIAAYEIFKHTGELPLKDGFIDFEKTEELIEQKRAH